MFVSTKDSTAEHCVDEDFRRLQWEVMALGNFDPAFRLVLQVVVQGEEVLVHPMELCVLVNQGRCTGLDVVAVIEPHCLEGVWLVLATDILQGIPKAVRLVFVVELLLRNLLGMFSEAPLDNNFAVKSIVHTKLLRGGGNCRSKLLGRRLIFREKFSYVF